jgi:hypothetical protein
MASGRLSLYWRWRSRPRGGPPKVSEEMRTLIRRIAVENSNWGTPKIHGELLKLGFEVSERTATAIPLNAGSPFSLASCWNLMPFAFRLIPRTSESNYQARRTQPRKSS